jgi:hypothetical protein
MIYVKALLAGLAAMLLAVIFVPMVVLTIASFFRNAPAGSGDKAIIWDLRSALSNPTFFWLYFACVMAAFGIAFYWEFRRVSH